MRWFGAKLDAHYYVRSATLWSVPQTRHIFYELCPVLFVRSVTHPENERVTRGLLDQILNQQMSCVHEPGQAG